MPGAARLYPVLLGAVLALSLIRYDRTVLVLLLGFLLYARHALSAAIRARTELAIAVALLLAWVAGLCWWRGDRLALQFLVQYAGFAALFFAAAAMLASGRSGGRPAWMDRRLLMGFLVLVSLLLVVPRDILHGDFLKVFRPDEAFEGRWSLVFNNPNVYGMVMATGFCLAVTLWREARLPAWLLAGLGTLFLFQVAMSGSRNAFGVAGLGAAALVLLAWRGDGARAMRLAAVMLVAAIALAIAYLAATGQLTHAGQMQATTLEVRLHAWRQTIDQVAAYPWTGVGTEALLTGRPVRHAHNLPLTFAAEFGLVGLALALAVVVLALRGATALALVPLIPAFAGQAIDDFHFQRTFGLMAAVLLAGAAFSRTDRAPPVSASA
jgi:hypothetical protein